MNACRTTKKRIKIGFKGIVNTTDENLLDFTFAKRAYNVAFDGGLLTSHIGIDKAQGFLTETTRFDIATMASSKQIKNVFFYRYYNAGAMDYKLIAQLKDGTIWQTRLLQQNGWAQIQGLTISGDIEAVNYRYNGTDVLLLATENAPLVYLSGDTVVTVQDAPHFASIAVYNERVFGCVNGANTRLWFSDDFDPTDWDISSEDAGFVEFVDECGNILKLVPFLGQLYVFRDYGIFRFTGYGDQSTFALKRVFTDTGRIYKRTIVNCGDKIIFLADEGLFAFDGYDVVRIAKEMPKVSNKEYAVGGYVNKKYYLACYTEVDTSYVIAGAKANGVIVYDVFDNSINIMAGMDVSCMCEVKTHFGGGLYCGFGTTYRNRLGMFSESGKLLTANLSKKYWTPVSNFGTSTFKIVRHIYVKTDYAVTINLFFDDKTRACALSGSTETQKIILDRPCQKFGMSIVCTTQNLSLCPIVVVMDFMQE